MKSTFCRKINGSAVIQGSGAVSVGVKAGYLEIIAIGCCNPPKSNALLCGGKRAYTTFVFRDAPNHIAPLPKSSAAPEKQALTHRNAIITYYDRLQFPNILNSYMP